MQWSVCARATVTALVLGALAVHPVSAAIVEVKVLTAGHQAESGRSSGRQITVVLV
jgi:hypothetical protein